MKKVLAVLKGIMWFVTCGFAGHGLGVWMREEAIEKKSLPKLILSLITTIGVIATTGWAGRLIAEKLYDEFVEEEEEDERRSR